MVCCEQSSVIRHICLHFHSEGSGRRTEPAEASIQWKVFGLLEVTSSPPSLPPWVCIHTVLIWQDDRLFRAVPASYPSWRLKGPRFLGFFFSPALAEADGSSLHVYMGFSYLQQLQSNMQTKESKFNLVSSDCINLGVGDPWQQSRNRLDAELCAFLFFRLPWSIFHSDPCHTHTHTYLYLYV